MATHADVFVCFVEFHTLKANSKKLVLVVVEPLDKYHTAITMFLNGLRCKKSSNLGVFVFVFNTGYVLYLTTGQPPSRVQSEAPRAADS